jgi:hypothetical protein
MGSGRAPSYRLRPHQTCRKTADGFKQRSASSNICFIRWISVEVADFIELNSDQRREKVNSDQRFTALIRTIYPG